MYVSLFVFFFFQAEDGIRDVAVTGVQTCALPISYLQNVTDSADAAPTSAEEAVFAELDQRLEAQLGKWRAVLAKDVPALNDAMRKNKIGFIAPPPAPAKKSRAHPSPAGLRLLSAHS